MKMTEITGPRGFWGAAPTRFVVMFLVLVLGYAAAQVALLTIAAHAPAALRVWLPIGVAPVFGLMLIGLYAGLVRLLERRRSSELAFRPGARLTLRGVLVGITLFCAVYAILWAEGFVRFKGINSPVNAAFPLALAILSGVGEELAFRGVVFRVVEESCGTLVALIISAGFFGLAHVSAPGATVVSTLAIVLEAGLLLGAAYAATRSLWFPIGLHFGWNATEGSVFGSAVSGHAARGLLNAPVIGPAAATGGPFGPEASPAAVGICLIAATAFLALAAARGRWAPLTFRLYPRPRRDTGPWQRGSSPTAVPSPQCRSGQPNTEPSGSESKGVAEGAG